MFTTRNKRWLAAALALPLLASGCSLLPREEEPLQPPLVKPVKETFETVEVKSQTIVKQFTGVGTLTSTDTQNVFFTESKGRLWSINVGLGDPVKRGDVLALLDAADLEVKIKQKKLAVEKSLIALEQAKEEKRGDGNAIRLKAIDVEIARVELEELERQFARTRLISELDGVVTYVTNLRQGDEVEAYSAILTVSDPTKMHLVYESSNTNDFTGIQLNMDVQMKYRDKAFTGRVVQVPSTAPYTDNKTLAEKNARTIIMSVEGIPPEAEIGNLVDFTIVTERRDNVLVIPRTGLRTYLARDYVQILDGESRREVDVEKGITTQTEVEIRKGLQEGQQVILNN